MQFLKSILSKSSTKESESMKTKALRQELDCALSRIEELEAQVEKSNDAIVELSSCVKNIAFATQNLSQEVVCITTLIQQAADLAQKDTTDFFGWNSSDNDDDGYLN